MKFPIATTPEQYARLKACGVDPKTADMYWAKDTLGIFNLLHVGNPFMYNDIPAYSLSRLLSLFPPEIEDESDLCYRFFLTPSTTSDNKVMWEVEYYSPLAEIYLMSVASQSLIEACVKAIEWLTREGHKLNTIEE